MQKTDALGRRGCSWSHRLSKALICSKLRAAPFLDGFRASKRAPLSGSRSVASSKVAPAQPVAPHYALDSQAFSRLPPVPCCVVSQGCYLPAWPALFSNILRQEEFKKKLRPGTKYAPASSCPARLAPPAWQAHGHRGKAKERQQARRLGAQHGVTARGPRSSSEGLGRRGGAGKGALFFLSPRFTDEHNDECSEPWAPV
jgi:hypothetical protein